MEAAKEYHPRPYQVFAENKIIELPAIGLFLPMGMGKTSSTLSAIDKLLFDWFEVSNVLVIAPLRVADDTWSREIEKWNHLRHLKISKVLGSEIDRIRALQKNADIYTINRENVEWLVKYYGKKWPFRMVVIDESSSFKNHSAKRFKALRKVRPLIPRIVELSGTPVPNGLLDLWSQIYLLDGGERLGKTYSGYRERYFQPDKRNQTMVFSWKLRPGAEAEIYRKISDICVSLSADDWLQLPERIDNPIVVKLPAAAKAKYKQLEKDLLLPLTDTDVVANTAAGLSNKLLQMANGAVYDENGQAQEIHQAKLDALGELIDTANGQPVLVYYTYQHDRDRILKRFPEARIISTTKDIADWNAGKIAIGIAHPAAIGHGLNLQDGGHIIIWFGLTWNLEWYQQANARLHRQGQEHSVVVNHLVAEGTEDEDVMVALQGKAVSQDAMLAAVKARIEQVRREAA